MKQATNRVLFFDVETPNKRQDRICSLGIIAVIDGQTVLEKNYLINPEVGFDDRNMSIHHITPDMVANAPTFPEVWSEIKQFFRSCLVVGHGVGFDLSVLDKSLIAYDLAEGTEPVIYADTLNKAQNSFALSKYSLDYLCDYWNVQLPMHHNSLCDAKSTQAIYEIIDEEIGWDQSDFRTKYFGTTIISKDKKKVCKDINDLRGMLLGIVIDDAVGDREKNAIRSWITNHRDLAKMDEYESVLRFLYNTLEDNANCVDDIKLVIQRLNDIEPNTYSIEITAIHILKGIIRGILSDQIISISELNRLSRWMESFDRYMTSFPFNRIRELIHNVLEDGIITSEEQEQLHKVFSEFVDPITSISNSRDKELCIDLTGKTVLITGTCSSGTRDEVLEKLVQAGAIIGKSISRKLDILIVGGQGSSDWKYDNYGTKLNKALELNEKGANIQIIGEKEIFGGNV